MKKMIAITASAATEVMPNRTPRPASSASLRRVRAPGESSMDDGRFIYFSGTGT